MKQKCNGDEIYLKCVTLKSHSGVTDPLLSKTSLRINDKKNTLVSHFTGIYTNMNKVLMGYLDTQ